MRRLGAPKKVHAEREELSTSSAEWRIKQVHTDLDAVERGDVYSCDQALFDLIEVGVHEGAARSESRGQGREPGAKLNKLHQLRRDAEKRFHKICVRADQLRQGTLGNSGKRREPPPGRVFAPPPVYHPRQGPPPGVPVFQGTTRKRRRK